MVQCWEADSLTLTATDRGQGSLINFLPPIPRQQIAETEAPPSCDSLTFLGGNSFLYTFQADGQNEMGCTDIDS